jgi:hypothetical protein
MEISSVILTLVLCGTLSLSAVAAFNNSAHTIIATLQFYRKSKLYTQPEEKRLFSSCSAIAPANPVHRCKNEKTEVLLYVW